MSYGQSELNTLLSDASVTALVTAGVNGIIYDTAFPNKYPVTGTVVGNEDSFINYYRVTFVDAGLNYMQTTYSVNCRAATMANADALARAVLDVVNRHSSSSVFFVVSVLPVLPPADPTDIYNAPLEITAKGRTI